MKKGQTVVLSCSRATLKEDRAAVKVRSEGKPRFLRAGDGSVLWYGKPDFPEYYATLREGMQG